MIIILQVTKNATEIDDKIKSTESKLENLYNQKIKGAQVRYRIKWVEDGEKKYQFFPRS